MLTSCHLNEKSREVCIKARSPPASLVFMAYFQNHACYEKYFNDNKHNSLHLTLKICSDICPWILSFPQSSQFSLSFALKTVCPQTNVLAYFAANGSYCFLSPSSSSLIFVSHINTVTLPPISEHSKCET